MINKINKLFLFIFTLSVFSLTACDSVHQDGEEIHSSSHQAKTPGVLKQSQIIPTFLSCLRLPPSAITTQTKSSLEKLKGNLSSEGRPESMSAPMLMATTQLAGDICSDLIEYEKAQGLRFFNGFDLETKSIPGEPPLTETIDLFARSCWGRSAKGEEKSYILTEMSKTTLANNKGKSAAFFICTIMLSSPELIIY